MKEEQLKNVVPDDLRNVTFESKNDLKKIISDDLKDFTSESNNDERFICTLGVVNMKEAEEIKKAVEDVKKNVTLESKDNLENVMGSKDKLKNVTPDELQKSVYLKSKKE